MIGPYATLLLKELRSLRLLGLVLLAATAVIVVINIDAAEGAVNAKMMLLTLPYLCPPLLAGALIHSVSAEWNAHTQHLWLSLPLPHAALLLVKVTAVLLLGAAVFVLNTAGVHAVHEGVVASLGAMIPALVQVTAAQVWVVFGSLFGSYTAHLTGLACVAVAVRAGLRRFRALATVGVFLLGLWVTGWLEPLSAAALGPLFADGPGQLSGLAEVHLDSLHRALMGLLYTAAGAWGFARRAEA